jgi:transposase InsO family protein
MWIDDAVPSLGKFVYYVLFIDDYSQKTWIYFLKEKMKSSTKFQEFKDLVENLSERKIKVLRSNNGGEYTSNEFKDFCREEGIKRELKTPYNPQQNGVVERKNKSIVEVAKLMIHDQNLPMHLWEEASSTTCMSIIEVLTRYWGTRHLKRCSLERN